MALVVRRVKFWIITCRLLVCELLRCWRRFPGVRRSGLLFCSGLRFHSIRTVKAGTVRVDVSVYGAIDVGVVNHVGIHARDGGVITEAVSFPAAAPVTVARVAVAIVNASVKTDRRTPIASVKYVSAVVPAPPWWRPEQTH